MDDIQDSIVVVLVTIPFEEQWQEQLRQIAPKLRVEQHTVQSAHEIPASLWKEAQVLYTNSKILPEPEYVPKLRLVQLYSAGVDSAAKSALFQQRAVAFSTTSGVHAVNAAEYTFTMILAWSHKFTTMLQWKQSSQWPHGEERHALFMPETLQGNTIGIAGYGSIGRQIAMVAKAFGMRVLAMQHGSDHRDHGFVFPGEGDPDGTLPDQYYPPDQLHAFLYESDFVVVSLPLTSQTRGMFDDAAFEAMKPSAFFVNIGRGGVCNDDALVRALEKKVIAGAALDVFGKEPLPSDSRLWQLPNVFMTPHIMGTSPQYDERAAMIFIENVRRYLQGQLPYNVVNKEQGY